MLTDQVIVITGGSRGIGKIFAQRLSATGAQIIITGRDGQLLKTTAEEIGGNVNYSVFDVSNLNETRQAFLDIERNHGPIATLINNAGVLGPVDYFWKTDPLAWCEAIDINLKGSAICTHVALEQMILRQQGKIINISSNAGVFRWPTSSSYSVSKAAIIKLTENVAVEAKKHNISLFSYHPGLIHSDGMAIELMNEQLEDDSPRKNILKWYYSEQEKGRTVDAADSASKLLQLVAGDYSQLSGRYLTVYDDLDELLQRIEQVQQEDLLTLRLRALPAS